MVHRRMTGNDGTNSCERTMSYVGTDVAVVIVVALIVVVVVVVVVAVVIVVALIVVVVVVGSTDSGSEANTSLAHGLEQMLYTSRRARSSSCCRSSRSSRVGGVV